MTEVAAQVCSACKRGKIFGKYFWSMGCGTRSIKSGSRSRYESVKYAKPGGEHAERAEMWTTFVIGNKKRARKREACHFLQGVYGILIMMDHISFKSLLSLGAQLENRA